MASARHTYTSTSAFFSSLHLVPLEPSVMLTTSPSIHALTTTPSLDSISTIRNKTDMLFFVQYTPTGTTRPRLFLVHNDLDLSDLIVDNCSYFCTFLMCHPPMRTIPILMQDIGLNGAKLVGIKIRYLNTELEFCFHPV